MAAYVIVNKATREVKAIETTYPGSAYPSATYEIVPMESPVAPTKPNPDYVPATYHQDGSLDKPAGWDASLHGGDGGQDASKAHPTCPNTLAVGAEPGYAEKRSVAYKLEADGLFAAWQGQEEDSPGSQASLDAKTAWTDKRDEIKARYPAS